ncbi:hypothetical protein EV702DRAFT_1053730, partial [Suillus placidus]
SHLPVMGATSCLLQTHAIWGVHFCISWAVGVAAGTGCTLLAHAPSWQKKAKHVPHRSVRHLCSPNHLSHDSSYEEATLAFAGIVLDGAALPLSFTGQSTRPLWLGRSCCWACYIIWGISCKLVRNPNHLAHDSSYGEATLAFAGIVLDGAALPLPFTGQSTRPLWLGRSCCWACYIIWGISCKLVRNPNHLAHDSSYGEATLAFAGIVLDGAALPLPFTGQSTRPLWLGRSCCWACYIIWGISCKLVRNPNHLAHDSSYGEATLAFAGIVLDGAALPLPFTGQSTRPLWLGRSRRWACYIIWGISCKLVRNPNHPSTRLLVWGGDSGFRRNCVGWGGAPSALYRAEYSAFKAWEESPLGLLHYLGDFMHTCPQSQPSITRLLGRVLLGPYGLGGVAVGPATLFEGFSAYSSAIPTI